MSALPHGKGGSSTKPPAQAEAARWFKQARQDLLDAEFAESGGRYNLACFLAQQAAEKALKAFLIHRGAEAVWGHSVADLCDDAAQFDPDFRRLREKAAPLDSYYLPTRYPDALPGGTPSEAFAAEDAALALARARAVLEAVQQRIDGGG